MIVQKRKVVDQNYLRLSTKESGLMQYLKDGNIAILHDYTALESTRGDAQINLRRSIEVVKNYPKKILFLKDMRDVIRITNNTIVNPDDLIDRKTTVFSSLVFNIIETEDELLKQNSEIANNWFSEKDRNAQDEIDSLRTFKSGFIQKELKQYANWYSASIELKQKIVSLALEDAHAIWITHGYKTEENENIRANSFIFRFSLAVTLLCLKWIENAMFEKSHSSRIASNLIDATYYVLGTYFDGCLTNDRLSQDISSKLFDCLRVCYEPENIMVQNYKDFQQELPNN